MHMIAALGRWRRASLTANGVSMVRREVRAGDGTEGRRTYVDREGRTAGAAIARLGKPVISLHLEVGEYARQTPLGGTTSWIRSGKRSSKRYQRNVFLHKQRLTGTNFARAILSECCVGGGLSGRTRREVDHDKLKELCGERQEGGWAAERPKILGSVGERAWHRCAYCRIAPLLRRSSINRIGSACLWCCAAGGSGSSCQRHISVHASTASLSRQSAKV
ncbi:hypothetical protein B0H13DRAFT_2563699 [Mycena leptocephala]|nr:hypothetical protein B0H13DRAFT_2563699 [Mycena leptocephala]